MSYQAASECSALYLGMQHTSLWISAARKHQGWNPGLRFLGGSLRAEAAGGPRTCARCQSVIDQHSLPRLRTGLVAKCSLRTGTHVAGRAIARQARLAMPVDLMALSR